MVNSTRGYNRKVKKREEKILENKNVEERDIHKETYRQKIGRKRVRTA